MTCISDLDIIVPFSVLLLPGPTQLWSAFSDSVESATAALKSGLVFAVVTERMDESLIALRYHLGWSLADVVVTK